MPQKKSEIIGYLKGRKRALAAGLGLLLLIVIFVRFAGPDVQLTWVAGFQYRLVYLLTPCCGKIHQYEDENMSFSWRESCGEDNSGGGGYSAFASPFLNDVLRLSSAHDKIITAGNIQICRYENAAKAFIPAGVGAIFGSPRQDNKPLGGKSAGASGQGGPDSGSLRDILGAIDARVGGRMKSLKTRAGEIAVVDNIENDVVCFHDASKRLYCFSGTASPRAGADYSILGRLYFELTGSGLTSEEGPFQAGVIDWLKTPSFAKRKVCRTETIIKTLRIKGR